MTARPQSRILDEIVHQHGRHASLGRKFRANRDRNWLLALILNAFAKQADGAQPTDLDTILTGAFEKVGLGEQMKEHAALYAALSPRARQDLFPGAFGTLTTHTGYTVADLRRDLPALDAAVLAMPNAADVDVAGVHQGRVHLADLRRPRRSVVSTHGGELTRAVERDSTTRTDPLTDPFSIKATSFHCTKETGVSWLGSDEVYWIFGSVGAGVAITTMSHTFEDIDSGDNASFGDGEGWIWGQQGQPLPLPNGEIGSLVSLWEHDTGDPDEVKAATEAAFAAAAGILAATGVAAWIAGVVAGVGAVVTWLIGFMDDDHIADQTFIFSRQTIIAQAGKIGQSFDVTRQFTDGDGDYTLTIGVTHLGPPPPTTTVPDVLEASLSSALAQVNAAGLVPRATGSGGPGAWVFRQSPLGGSTAPLGSEVTLLLRTGPRP